MSKRVLILEADRSVRKALSKVLVQSGYDVLAADGTAAVSHIETGTVDLVLLDLDGAEQDIWDLLGYTTVQWPFIPAIIITSRIDPSDPATIPPIFCYLEKPLEVSMLLKTIEAILAEGNLDRFICSALDGLDRPPAFQLGVIRRKADERFACRRIGR